MLNGDTISIRVYLLMNVSYKTSQGERLIPAGTTIDFDPMENIGYFQGDHFLVFEDEYKIVFDLAYSS